MNITPLRNCIFVLPDKVIDKTETGIILSDYSKRRPTSGTIIAMGTKVTDFKIGDRIIYGDFSGQKQIINYQGEDTEVFLMTEDDILAMLTEK